MILTASGSPSPKYSPIAALFKPGVEDRKDIMLTSSFFKKPFPIKKLSPLCGFVLNNLIPSRKVCLRDIISWYCAGLSS